MLCSVLLLSALAQDDRIVTTLAADGESPRLFVSQMKHPLSPAFTDPLHRWEFPYLAEGVAGGVSSTLSPRVRFKVYAQSAKSRALLVPTTRSLVRIWDECVTRVNIDHPSRYGLMVHVFICDGGKAGGEQTFIKSRNPADNFATYNAVYLYHAEGLTNPMEAVREIAHEYGHAVLPPVGGFKEPEDWANGSLGERLFIRYLYRSAEVQPDDIFGLGKSHLKAWLAIYADPLAASIARRRIDQSTLGGVGPPASNEYLGLVLLLDDLFPDLVGRALKMSGGQTAIDALKGAIDAVNEQKGWVMDIPGHYGSEIWVPIAGKCEWTGAKPIQTIGAWTKLRLTARKISARRL